MLVSFVAYFAHFVEKRLKIFAGYIKKIYLCTRVDQRVVLKLSQLIGY